MHRLISVTINTNFYTDLLSFSFKSWTYRCVYFFSFVYSLLEGEGQGFAIFLKRQWWKSCHGYLPSHYRCCLNVFMVCSYQRSHKKPMVCGKASQELWKQFILISEDHQPPIYEGRLIFMNILIKIMTHSTKKTVTIIDFVSILKSWICIII